MEPCPSSTGQIKCIRMEEKTQRLKAFPLDPDSMEVLVVPCSFYWLAFSLTKVCTSVELNATMRTV